MYKQDFKSRGAGHDFQVLPVKSPLPVSEQSAPAAGSSLAARLSDDLVVSVRVLLVMYMDPYVCIHIYIYIYIYVCTYLSLSLSLSIYIYIYIYVYVYIHIYIDIGC